MQLLEAKTLVTGAYGLLGSKLIGLLKNKYAVAGLDMQLMPEHAHPGVDYFEADIADYKQINELIRRLQPKYIFNAAAYTNVDKSETDREACWRANVEGVEYLAKAARGVDARIIHVSTDYVFDGTAGPYRESDRPNPLGYYGKSKLAGENALIASGADYAIARTMVLYGYANGVRPNFVTWVVDQLRNGEEIRVVDDQFGNPTLADELAEALIVLAESGAQGIYHICGKEIIDRYHFAVKIAEVFGLDASLIERIKTADLGQAALRPLNSGFYIDKAESEIGIHMSDTAGALAKFRRQYEKERE